MQFKGFSLSIRLFGILLIIIGMPNCAINTQGTSGLERVEVVGPSIEVIRPPSGDRQLLNRMTGSQIGRSLKPIGATAYTFELDEMRFIQRIAIHPAAPIKNIRIYIHTGGKGGVYRQEEGWKLIKMIKGRKDFAFIVDTSTKGDAVQVIPTIVGKNRRRQAIKAIEVYAQPK